ncbi:MAG TPA: tRNA-uridine aminocarboxypropyltransferase [Kofleriaceae bacterium]
MSRRGNLQRCGSCRMLDCICALVPSLAPSTRLALLVHYREARKPTNTGLLAARALAGSTVGIIGDRDRPLELPIVRPGERGVLLFPADDAVPIAAIERADVLVVPDGNWRQASKLRARVPGLAELPCAYLPDAPPTAYRLRSEPRAGGLATLEAIAHALRVLEGDRGPAIGDALLALMRAMVERTLASRGYSPSTL